MINLRAVTVLAMMLGVAGCGGDGLSMPPAPAPATSAASPAGNWSGSISDPISGDGTMQLVLSEQSPNVLTGTWSATYKDGDKISGPATAGLFAPSGYGVMLYVDPQPSCTAQSGSAPLGFTLINVAVTSNKLTAVAGRTSCNGFSFGAVSLSK